MNSTFHFLYRKAALKFGISPNSSPNLPQDRKKTRLLEILNDFILWIYSEHLRFGQQSTVQSLYKLNNWPNIELWCKLRLTDVKMLIWPFDENSYHYYDVMPMTTMERGTAWQHERFVAQTAKNLATILCCTYIVRDSC